MFIHKIDEDLTLKVIELGDGEKIFELTKGNGYLGLIQQLEKSKERLILITG